MHRNAPQAPGGPTAAPAAGPPGADRTGRIGTGAAASRVGAAVPVNGRDARTASAAPGAHPAPRRATVTCTRGAGGGAACAGVPRRAATVGGPSVGR